MPDILIRGMGMPDGCHNCRFSYFDKGETNDGEPCTVLMCSAMNQGTNGAEYDGDRPFWCPLVPLPEGHGRLIDADELMVKIKTESDLIEANFIRGRDKVSLALAVKQELSRVMEIVEKMPTIKKEVDNG